MWSDILIAYTHTRFIWRCFFIICRSSSFVQELWLDFVCYYCLLFSNHLKKTILFKSNCDKIPLNLVCLNISRKRAPKFTNVVGFINIIMVLFNTKSLSIFVRLIAWEYLDLQSSNLAGKLIKASRWPIMILRSQVKVTVTFKTPKVCHPL